MQSNPNIANKILDGVDAEPKQSSVASKILKDVDSGVSNKILQGIDQNTTNTPKPRPNQPIHFSRKVRTKPVLSIPEEYNAEYYKDRSWAHVISRAVRNFPRDSRKVARETLEMFVNPVETAEVLGKLGSESLVIKPFETKLKMSPAFVGGYLRELSERPPLDDKPIVGKSTATPMFDMMWEFYKNAYGMGPEGIGGFKHYVAESPAEFLGDLVSVLTLGAKGAGVGLKGVTVFNRAKLLQRLISNSKFLDYLPEDKRASFRNIPESEIIRRFEQSPTLRKYLPESHQRQIDRSSRVARAADSAYYIGTGSAGTGYKPGFWEKAATNALQYLDIGALPMAAGVQVASGALGLTSNAVKNLRQPTPKEDIDTITQYLFHKYKDQFPPEMFEVDDTSAFESMLDKIRVDIADNDAEIVALIEKRRSDADRKADEVQSAAELDDRIRDLQAVIDRDDEWWSDPDNQLAYAEDYVAIPYENWPYDNSSQWSDYAEEVLEIVQGLEDDGVHWDDAVDMALEELSDQGYGVDPVEHIKAYMREQIKEWQGQKLVAENQERWRTDTYYKSMKERSVLKGGTPTQQQIEMWDNDPNIYYRIGPSGIDPDKFTSPKDVEAIEFYAKTYEELGATDSAERLRKALEDDSEYAFIFQPSLTTRAFSEIAEAWKQRNNADDPQTIYVVKGLERDSDFEGTDRLVHISDNFAEIPQEFLDDPDNFKQYALEAEAREKYSDHTRIFANEEKMMKFFKGVLSEKFDFERADNPYDLADYSVRNYAKFMQDNFKSLIEKYPNLKNAPLAGSYHKNFVTTWNEITKRNRRKVLAQVEELSDDMDAPVEIVKVEPERWYQSRWPEDNAEMGKAQHGLTTDLVRKVKNDLGIPQLPDDIAPLANLESGNFYEVFDYSLLDKKVDNGLANMTSLVSDYRRQGLSPEEIESKLQKLMDGQYFFETYNVDTIEELWDLYEQAEVKYDELVAKYEEEKKTSRYLRFDRYYILENIPSRDGTDKYYQRFMVNPHREWLYDRLGVSTDAEVIELLKRYPEYIKHKEQREKLGRKNIYFRVEDWHDNILENPVSVETSPGYWGVPWNPGHPAYGKTKEEYLYSAMRSFNEYSYKKRGGPMERFTNTREFEEYLNNHKVYQFLEDGHAGPGVYMRGVNSLQSLEELQDYYIRHAGLGGESYRSLVVFQGKKLGQNLQQDGVVVQPEKVLKKYIFDFGEEFRELGRDISDMRPESQELYLRDIGFGDVMRYSMPQETRRLVYEIDDLINTIVEKQALFDEYTAIRDDYRRSSLTGASADDAFRRMTEIYEQISDQYDVTIGSMAQLEEKLQRLLDRSLEIDPESRRNLRALIDSLYADIYDNVDNSIGQYQMMDDMPLLGEDFVVHNPEIQELVNSVLDNAEEYVQGDELLSGSRPVGAEELDDLFDELLESQESREAREGMPAARTSNLSQLNFIEPAIDQLPYATRFDHEENLLPGDQFRDIRDGQIYQYSANGIHMPISQMRVASSDYSDIWRSDIQSSNELRRSQSIRNSPAFQSLWQSFGDSIENTEQLGNAIINYYAQKALSNWNSVRFDPSISAEEANQRYMQIMNAMRGQIHPFLDSDRKKQAIQQDMTAFERRKNAITRESESIQYANKMLASAFEANYMDSLKDYIDNFKYADPEQRSVVGKILLNTSVLPNDQLFKWEDFPVGEYSGVIPYFNEGQRKASSWDRARRVPDSEAVKALKFAAIEELFNTKDLQGRIEKMTDKRLDILFGGQVTDEIKLIAKALRQPEGDSVGFVKNATQPGSNMNHVISSSYALLEMLGNGDPEIGMMHLIFNMLGNEKVLEMLNRKGVMREILKNVDPNEVNRVRRWVYQYRGWLSRGYRRTTEEEK